MHLALFHRVAQRLDHVLLTDDVGKRPGTVAAVERRAGGHGKSSLVRAGDRHGPGLRPVVPGAVAPDIHARRRKTKRTVHPPSKPVPGARPPCCDSDPVLPRRLKVTA